MSHKLNAEELAAKRYPNPTAMIPQPDGTFLNINHSATAYSAAIREVAQPIADERDELREALDKAHNAMMEARRSIGDLPYRQAGECNDILWSEQKSIAELLAKYPKP
jgi:hypothetical protein